MRSINLTSFLLLLSVFAFLSCNINSGTSDNPEPSLNENTLFYVEEGYYPLSEVEEPGIFLRIFTEEVYHSTGFEIESTVTIEDDKIEIELIRVYQPGGLLYYPGRASKCFRLNISEGIYNLTFKNGNISYPYTLNIEKESLTLESKYVSVADSLPQIALKFNRFYRYPENSFVLLGSTRSNNSYKYEFFRDSLDKNPALTSFSFPGNGILPYDSEESGNEVNYPSSFYVYENEIDFKEIGEFLMNYSAENIYDDEGVYIHLRNWKNERIVSWLYDIE